MYGYRGLSRPEANGRDANPAIRETGRAVKAQKTPIRIMADPSRVITRFFLPGAESRAGAIVNRVATLDDDEVASLLTEVLARFSWRHKDIEEVLLRHFGKAARLGALNGTLPRERRLLIGAYCTLEYAIEAVALFNPSMVMHPVQEGTRDGEVRFLMSVRACGEGHISSIVFRTGTVDRSGRIQLDPLGRFASTARAKLEEEIAQEGYRAELQAKEVYDDFARCVLADLPDPFSIAELVSAIDRHRLDESSSPAAPTETVSWMLWLAQSSYRLDFPVDLEISERVIFPSHEHERRGIEDARFVRFTEDDGHVVYYGTFTAHDGSFTRPHVVETEDFRRFRIGPLTGRCLREKGAALFPRRIGGRYALIARLDGESLFCMQSGNIRCWNEATKLHGPTEPWEYMLVGNCGSPIETSQGWLLLTHGVGPMRRYCIGAMLLDRDDPARILARLREPLLVPDEEDRDGCVPNVVYSCGAMLHGDRLILPYGVSDTATRIASLSVAELLRRMT